MTLHQNIGQIPTEPNSHRALDRSFDGSEHGLLITGSLYLVAELLHSAGGFN